jgi:hypothetical protein
MLSGPDACRLPVVSKLTLGIFSAVVTGEPSLAKESSPSKNAYVASKNAFVILTKNSLGIGRLASREVDEGSVPLANLNAHVVTCRWKNWMCDRYSVVNGSDKDKAQFSK